MERRFGWMLAVAALALSLGSARAVETDPDPADETESTGEAEAPGYPSDAVFDYLMAEVAAKRGDLDGALAIYNRLARELQDPQIARRAVEAAIRARNFTAALDSATLLLELDPDSTLAREIMGALLANEGDLDKARERLADLLQKSPSRATAVLMQLSHLFAKFTNKAAVLEATRKLIEPYDVLPEAHYAVGVAALVAGKVDVALQEAEIGRAHV